VSQVKAKRGVVVKMSPVVSSVVATAKGGLGLVEAFAQRFRLWSDCEALLPQRRDPSQGFTTTAVVSAQVHGLLSGGEGFGATEALRGDEPLLRMLGLEAAPSAETVEEVVKYLGEHEDGQSSTQRLMRRHVRGMVGREGRRRLLEEGFVFLWGDGSLLEVSGKNFEALKCIDKNWGQQVCAVFAGPYLVGLDFARQGEGEETVVRRLMAPAVKEVLEPLKLRAKTLVLLDSLYGDEPTLRKLEDQKLLYVVGANKLEAVGQTLAEQPETVWRDTGENTSRGWSESGVCQVWLQCEDWASKRTLVGRRWKNTGEMIWNYAGVLTNLTPQHPVLAAKMEREKLFFEQALWSLYSRKQALENQWKELLSDLGLHHPPSAKVAANAIFYVIAGLAYNLAVGLRRLALEGEDRRMRLWRLRREFIDLAASVTRHARRVILQLLDARTRFVAKLQAALLVVQRL